MRGETSADPDDVVPEGDDIEPEQNYLAGTPIPNTPDEAGDAQTTIEDGAERLQEYGEDVSSSPEQRATQDDAAESLRAATDPPD